MMFSLTSKAQVSVHHSHHVHHRKHHHRTLQVQAPSTGLVRASFYADKFDGRKTASGSIFRQSKMTAASLTYPLGSVIKVCCPATGKTIIINVTDHGPYGKKFRLDLSKSAFEALGTSLRRGWMWVSISPVENFGAQVKPVLQSDTVDDVSPPEIFRQE
jgi:rare lipoprotein A